MRYEDKAALERLERKLAPAFREHQFVADLELLKGLARMAELKHQLQKKDAIDSGGDINAVGQSMDRERLKRDQLILAILKKIADDIPSEWSKNMPAATQSSDPAAVPSQAKETAHCAACKIKGSSKASVTTGHQVTVKRSSGGRSTAKGGNFGGGGTFSCRMLCFRSPSAWRRSLC